MIFSKEQKKEILRKFYANEDGFADTWYAYFDIISTDVIGKEKAYISVLKEIQEILRCNDQTSNS